MTIVPGETPCLRCVFEAAPGPGEVGTCETAGVLGPVVSIVASYQAAEALKILAGKKDAINRELVYVRRVAEHRAGGSRSRRCSARSNCPCCKQRKFEWLEGEHGTQTTSLCGRNAVQVSHRVAGKLNFEELARQLGVLGAGELQQVPAQVPATEAGRLRVHGLPRRPGDHQGDGRHGQGADAVREVHRALSRYDGRMVIGGEPCRRTLTSVPDRRCRQSSSTPAAVAGSPWPSTTAWSSWAF